MNKPVERLADKVFIWPDSILKKSSRPVTTFDRKLNQLIIKMFKTLKELNGVGLSACQIGDRRQVLVYSLGNDEAVLINPKIIEKSKETTEDVEGCISFPGVYVKVKRHNWIEVEAQNESGETAKKKYEGMLAACVQHEIDHLNGVTLVSYLSLLKREIVTRKMTKIQQRIKKMKRTFPNVKKRTLQVPTG